MTEEGKKGKEIIGWNTNITVYLVTFDFVAVIAASWMSRAENNGFGPSALKEVSNILLFQSPILYGSLFVGDWTSRTSSLIHHDH